MRPRVIGALDDVAKIRCNGCDEIVALAIVVGLPRVALCRACVNGAAVALNAAAGPPGGAPRLYPRARVGDLFGTRRVVTLLAPDDAGNERVGVQCEVCEDVTEARVFNLRKRSGCRHKCVVKSGEGQHVERERRTA